MSLSRTLSDLQIGFTGREDSKAIAAKTAWTRRPWGSKLNWTHGGVPVKTCVMKRKCRQCAAAMRRGEL